MTTEDRIKEIEQEIETFGDIYKENASFLLALVKVQREALGQINSNRYDPIVILDLVHRALSWKPEE